MSRTLHSACFRDHGNEYEQALEAAQRLDLDYRSALDTLHLVTIDDQRTRVVSSREFLLG